MYFTGILKYKAISMSFTFVQKTLKKCILMSTADYSLLTYNKLHFSLQCIVTGMHLNNIRAQLNWNIKYLKSSVKLRVLF